VALDDLFTNYKPDSAPLVFVPLVKALKNHEYLLEVLTSDSDAVIRYRKLPRIVRFDRSYVKQRLYIRLSEFYSVPQEVLKQLYDLDAVARNCRKIVSRDARIALLDGHFEIRESAVEDIVAVRRLEGSSVSADP
jgi:hypothetical protein